MNRLKIMLVLAILGLLVAISLVVRQSQSVPEATCMIAPPPVSTFHTQVAGTGIIEAIEENRELGVYFTGVVKELFVKVGDVVKAGQPLLKLDDTVAEAELEVARKQVAVKEAELKKNQAELARIEAVKDPRAISLDILDDKRKDVLIAMCNLELAVAELKREEITLEKYTILSPQDGIVYKIDVRPGEYINNDLAQFTLNPRLTVGKSSSLQVRVDVDEENAGRIQPHQQAIAYTKGLNKTKIDLEFLRIEPYVIPKRNLTGATTELVDTRVLQVIYKIKERPQDLPKLPIYIGQQVDVYIEAP
jgi:HlyD family secretion protein